MAARQHGVIATRQLAQLGITHSAIRRRVAAGRLHRLHWGVYAVGHSRVSTHGRWLAAVLACGPDALLSHRSAAALWGIRSHPPGPVDVTVPGRGRRRRQGIRVHVSRQLGPEVAARRNEIPVTSVPRTLLDLAETLHFDLLERAVAEADRLELLDLADMDRLLSRSRGRRGRRRLTVLLATGVAPTRSGLEQAFVRLCRDFELATPEINVAVAGLEVDALWRGLRLIVEVDSWEFHRGRDAFEHDRARDAQLQLAGYRVIRVTWRALSREPAKVAETIRRLLASPPA
jgi:very-short-patch-repair endonuclease